MKRYKIFIKPRQQVVIAVWGGGIFWERFHSLISRGCYDTVHEDLWVTYFTIECIWYSANGLRSWTTILQFLRCPPLQFCGALIHKFRQSAGAPWDLSIYSISRDFPSMILWHRLCKQKRTSPICTLSFPKALRRLCSGKFYPLCNQLLIPKSIP